MPELPEVETTRLAILPHLLGQTIEKIVLRCPNLRFPLDENLYNCQGTEIQSISRRGKYLIFSLSNHHKLLIHLGMSGYLRITDQDNLLTKHDHVDLCLHNGLILRYNDSRRFGFWLYQFENNILHPLLKSLGPEPLSAELNPDYLFKITRNKRQPIKATLMDNHNLVGVGNIYASESLFLAQIHPARAAQSLSLSECDNLVNAIKTILKQALAAGGTTIRDFLSPTGKQGYFTIQLKIYGRQGEACYQCQSIVEHQRIAGRSSPYCPSCQSITK